MICEGWFLRGDDHTRPHAGRLEFQGGVQEAMSNVIPITVVLPMRGREAEGLSGLRRAALTLGILRGF
jgi:hypothetical protein